MNKDGKVPTKPTSLTEFLLAEEGGFVFFNEENGDMFAYQDGEVIVVRNEEAGRWIEQH